MQVSQVVTECPGEDVRLLRDQHPMTGQCARVEISHQHATQADLALVGNVGGSE